MLLCRFCGILSGFNMSKCGCKYVQGYYSVTGGWWSTQGDLSGCLSNILPTDMELIVNPIATVEINSRLLNTLHNLKYYSSSYKQDKLAS